MNSMKSDLNPNVYEKVMKNLILKGSLFQRRKGLLSK